MPVAGKDELTNFNLIFWNKARKDITDGHIWFSVFGEFISSFCMTTVSALVTEWISLLALLLSQQ